MAPRPLVMNVESKHEAGKAEIEERLMREEKEAAEREAKEAERNYESILHDLMLQDELVLQSSPATNHHRNAAYSMTDRLMRDNSREAHKKVNALVPWNQNDELYHYIPLYISSINGPDPRNRDYYKRKLNSIIEQYPTQQKREIIDYIQTMVPPPPMTSEERLAKSEQALRSAKAVSERLEQEKQEKRKSNQSYMDRNLIERLRASGVDPDILRGLINSEMEVKRVERESGLPERDESPDDGDDEEFGGGMRKKLIRQKYKTKRVKKIKKKRKKTKRKVTKRKVTRRKKIKRKVTKRKKTKRKAK